jgi:5-methylcytosine-specific restriction endonuclease McrA
MPRRAMRQCAKCRRLHDEQRCPHCYQPWSTSTRGNGSTRAWRRLRLAVFAEQSYICAVDGCSLLCTELDHVINLASGGTDERSNLQGLCTDHHREKTEREAQHARHSSS